jgi:hypothetical protein
MDFQATALGIGSGGGGFGVPLTLDPTITVVDDGQPAIVTEKAQAWVEFSIEVDQDWLSLQGDLVRLLTEGKNNVEADTFVNGAGHASNEPEGLMTGPLRPECPLAGQHRHDPRHQPPRRLRGR